MEPFGLFFFFIAVNYLISGGTKKKLVKKAIILPIPKAQVIVK